jgi:NHL repeat
MAVLKRSSSIKFSSFAWLGRIPQPLGHSRRGATSTSQTGTRTPASTKYSPDGKLLFSWGEPGTAAGQFNLVHNIACDGDGWVYVGDRENHRVQVFDSNGKYETQWNNLMRPWPVRHSG